MRIVGALTSAVLSVALLLGVVACTDTGDTDKACEAGKAVCKGNALMRCAGNGSGYVLEDDCASKNKICTEDKGCMVCRPEATQCIKQDIVKCKADGSGYDTKPMYSCDGDKGMICRNGGCVNACKLAQQNRSYQGCEYWAVDLDNAVVTTGSAASQQFAVVLSNPSHLPAKITVTQNDGGYAGTPKITTVKTTTLKPQGLEVLQLAAREVDGSPAGKFNTGSGTAVTSNAYKITSHVPIIAYQFNPLSNAGVFSNDASLLVPVSALTSSATDESGAGYLVMGWPQTIAKTSDPDTNFKSHLRAFLTIVGTRKVTKVKVTLAAATVADSAGLVAAKKKGEILNFELDPYEVLNLETGDFASDFTGTRISADKPVVVFSGSEASDVPDFTTLKVRKCCADHLEQQLFPTATFGKVFIALKTPSRTDALYKAGANLSVNPKEREYFRILSAGEMVQVTTNLPGKTKVPVADGKHTQLAVDRDFTIAATGPVAVGQFVAGQAETGIPSSLPGGDPSFILLPPAEQFRKDYLFLTPDKYAFDFVMIAAPRGAKVLLDSRALKDGCDSTGGKKVCCAVSAVGSVTLPGDKAPTLYDAYKCQLSFPTVIAGKVPPDNLAAGSQNDGVHRLTADKPVGLVVYGFDAYVSYGYPGGTDLALINIK